ncbi:hypothetical protein VTN77DRAFT_8411 [Rasamsonia byssochlamydoides]|uniref:uncharacterized protein n=1 Tax=Rasamsonia byssochlamydoides TaxID=89139 RepID=UPI003742607E
MPTRYVHVPVTGGSKRTFGRAAKQGCPSTVSIQTAYRYSMDSGRSTSTRALGRIPADRNPPRWASGCVLCKACSPGQGPRTGTRHRTEPGPHSSQEQAKDNLLR